MWNLILFLFPRKYKTWKSQFKWAKQNHISLNKQLGFVLLSLKRKPNKKEKKKIDKASIFNAYPQFIITQRQQKTHTIPIPNTNQWNETKTKRLKNWKRTKTDGLCEDLSDLKGFDGIHCLTDPTHSHSLSFSLSLSDLSYKNQSKPTFYFIAYVWVCL